MKLGIESSILRSHFCFYFSKEKLCEWKKAVNLTSHPASQHIYTHVYFVHTYEYMWQWMYAEICCICILRALQVSPPDSWAHIRVTHVQCVCVHKYMKQVYICMYICTYVHMHIYTCIGHTYIFTYMYHTYVYTRVNIHTYIYFVTHVSVYTWRRTCIS